MTVVTIRHGLFRYYNPETQIVNGKDEEVLVERMAFHNETVDVPRDADLERGNRLNAFWTESEAKQHYDSLGIPAPLLGGLTPAETAAIQSGQTATEDVEVELASLDDEELVDWLMSTGRFDGQSKPTVNEVVEAAQGDPDLAARLEVAEHTASGDAPRQGVIDGLGKVTA